MHLQGAQVTVEWRTKSPYESVVQCSASGAKLEGLTLRHSSPSVANNYAVYVQVMSQQLGVMPETRGVYLHLH